MADFNPITTFVWALHRQIFVAMSPNMIYVAVGIAGFMAGCLFDFASLVAIRGARPLLWVVHSALITFALIMLSLSPDKLGFPESFAIPGGIVLLVFGLFEIYSLFVDLPLRKTYTSDSIKQGLVKTGTYALVRHPGVLWWPFVLTGLILVSDSRPLLLSSPLWIFLDVLWAIIQERYVFTKTLKGYREYQRETPMFIPSRRSIRAFIESLTFLQKEEDHA